MNKKLAIEILKQANIETTVGCCEKCPRKDKNKTCIGCLDNAKNILLNHINNLQSKIDKATKKADELRKYIYSELVDFNVCGSTEAHCLAKDLLDILKEDK